MASTAFFWAMACFTLSGVPTHQQADDQCQQEQRPQAVLIPAEARAFSPAGAATAFVGWTLVRRGGVAFAGPRNARQVLGERRLPGKPNAGRQAMGRRLPAGRIAQPSPKTRPMELARADGSSHGHLVEPVTMHARIIAAYAALQRNARSVAFQREGVSRSDSMQRPAFSQRFAPRTLRAACPLRSAWA